MSWENVKLGDIADFSNGINFGKEAYGKGVKLIGVSNFGNRFSPDYDTLEEVKEEVVRENDYLSAGDIVFVRSNGNKELVGRCMLVDSPKDKITYSGFCIRARIKDITKHHPVFWTYHFKGKSFRKSMSGTAIGANIQNLSQGRLASYETSVPDHETQVRIADILFAYDSLIENNQKQIKLLEEAAQRLYKEWFVDLRFPGYEDVEVVDGVPEGWKKEHIGNLIKKVTRTKQIKTAEYLPEGTFPIIDQSRDFIAGYTNDQEAVVDMGCPVIVFGDHTRILKYIQFPFAKGADGTQLIISNNENMPQSLLYSSLVAVDLSNYHYARHFKYLKAENILVPSREIAKEFDWYVSPMLLQIQQLRNMENKAAEARDRLLPKLMSGEIEV
ncbi:restriction endonuclease subunit S [Blautia sp. HCN-1074]|jgi:type I restriction enzyme S subunit|uniref:restriction endonuclease subunit S n=1 Tax=Blautia sp. HCN-1074 TaxID=3134667 RepID=UPI000E4416A5|nr:restriction endonuclease subunit S [uncultured Blautia sp.]RGI61854.1 restriction endonuclease subunit S [Ruminococcus sp. TM10-9AT]RGW19262.1 restriction endonuclease subunit S [Ruminococcus sp. AF13-37]RGW21014.1 restriction endonuclease subunit S [Ruminococcus sp. AF13-28]